MLALPVSSLQIPHCQRIQSHSAASGIISPQRPWCVTQRIRRVHSPPPPRKHWRKCFATVDNPPNHIVDIFRYQAGHMGN
ncbi:MAG: hypothetical protein ACTS77_01480 [Arsenophonus sp. NC-TX2-MAG3]